MLTGKQLSKLAGISPRTLHYYDQIDLLKPSRVAENGYRYYDDACVLQLQQILFYRELNMPLLKIKQILAQPSYNLVEALESHKQELQKRIHRLQSLVATVENTIQHIQGEKKMNKKQFFQAFSEELQAEYEKEAIQMYDPETVKESNRKWKNYSQSKKDSILAEGNEIYQALADAIDQGADSENVQTAIARWHHHIQNFWSPNEEQLLGLADRYNDDPRFKKTFDAFDPRLAEFIPKAVRIYIERKKK